MDVGTYHNHSLLLLKAVLLDRLPKVLSDFLDGPLLVDELPQSPLKVDETEDLKINIILQGHYGHILSQQILGNNLIRKTLNFQAELGACDYFKFLSSKICTFAISLKST